MLAHVCTRVCPHINFPGEDRSSVSQGWVDARTRTPQTHMIAAGTSARAVTTRRTSRAPLLVSTSACAARTSAAHLERLCLSARAHVQLARVRAVARTDAARRIVPHLIFACCHFRIQAWLRIRQNVWL